MSTRIDNLINDINNAVDSLPSITNELRVIIGNDSYPSGGNISSSGISLYTGYGFNEVAFLTNNDNLNLVSIIGILLGSIDDAVELILRIHKNDTTMNKFALYLVVVKKLMIINQNRNSTNIYNLFSNYTNNKVLYVGSKEDRKYQSKVKSFIFIPHCSGQAYGDYPKECYQSYFERTYAGRSSMNATIADFTI